jgi:hypothetical protein
VIVFFLSVFAFFFFGLEHHAFAWGAGAHVDFALEILGNGALLAPAVRQVLKKFPKSYLYGNLAADTVIGKNLAKSEEEHVHNWEVGLKLHELAKDDADRAFVFGYLSHLSADTVAHNYFVPKKRVDSFRSIAAGHAYWELRYDSFLPAHVWEASRDLGKERFPAHDELLNAGITATIFNVQTNRLVWDGFLHLTRRMERWRSFMRNHAERSQTPFTAEEREEFRTLAIGAMLDFLNNERDSKTYVADPTGNVNLERAWKIGALLRKGAAAGRIPGAEADVIAKHVGRALKIGLHEQREADLAPALHRLAS